MHKHIKNLALSGIKTFPCNKTKAPITSNGFHDATNDLEKLKKIFNKDDLLIGLATGNANKIVVIDIDVNKKVPGSNEIDQRSVEELIKDLEDLLGEQLPETIQVSSPSGGRHLYFKVDYTELNSATRFFDKTLPIDIRANGGYIIFADDINYCFYDNFDEDITQNFIDKLVPLPECISNYKKTHSNNIVEIQHEKDPLSKSEIHEIRSALSYLSSDDRDIWIRIGMILKSTGSDAAYGLWNEWSQTSDKYNPKDMEKRWKGLKPTEIELGSLFFEAKKYGWSTKYKQKQVEHTTISPKNIEKKNIPKNKNKTRKTFPKDLLIPKGLVGDFANYINSVSIKSQPIFDLAAALTAVGTLLGRKIQTQTKVRTNIYTLAVGITGCGKDAARGAIKNLFSHANCSELCQVEDIASDAAINTILNCYPTQLFLLDEIGRFLTSIMSQTKHPHLYNIVTSLLKLYSSSSNRYYGKIYADKDKQVIIEQPNLCLYGTTVPQTLYDCMSTENITDGFLSRLLIFESEDEDPEIKENLDLTLPPPESLIKQIIAICDKPINSESQGNLANISCNVPKPQVVRINNDAKKMLTKFRNEIRILRKQLRENNRIDVLYNRTPLLAEQIALIIAGGINIDKPKITEYEIDYGIKLAKHLADNMLFIADNYISENKFQKNLKKILLIIQESGKISKSKLTRRIQNLPSCMRKDILETLEDSEDIIVSHEGDTVKKTTYYTAN